MNACDVSVVVCTRNRADMLRGALASLDELAAERFTYEIVVLDNGSTDATADVIAELARTTNRTVRGVYEPEAGIVPARNRGVHEAHGRWIAFFDDDQLADKRWLTELYDGACVKQCRVVGGAVHLALPSDCSRQLDPTVRMLLGEAKLADEPRPYGGRFTPGCGNLMVERTVFDQVGLFQRTIGGRGEDTDLFSRIERAGIAAWYFPTAVVHHLTPPERLEPSYLLSLARRMGAGIAERQAGQMQRGRFAALWLAKAVRLGLVQAPQLLVSCVRGDQETAIGRRCLLAINSSFLRSGIHGGGER
jgi:glycosyltransferase involved in cell wall biosynthesis